MRVLLLARLPAAMTLVAQHCSLRHPYSVPSPPRRRFLEIPAEYDGTFLENQVRSALRPN